MIFICEKRLIIIFSGKKRWEIRVGSEEFGIELCTGGNVMYVSWKDSRLFTNNIWQTKSGD